MLFYMSLSSNIFKLLISDIKNQVDIIRVKVDVISTIKETCLKPFLDQFFNC